MKVKNIILSSIATLAIFSSANLFAQEIVEPSGIDQIKNIVASDVRLNKKVSREDINTALVSIDKMNNFIKEAVYNQGLANDGDISVADTRDINKYLISKYEDRWTELRRKYKSIERRGARTIVMNKNAVNSLWANIYNLGFAPLNRKRLSNVNGGKSAGFVTVGYDLSEVLKSDIKSGILNNPNISYTPPSTDTGLDRIIDVILNDEGLLNRVSTSNMRKAAENANEMNKLILEAIVKLGLANDSKLTTADIRDINHYLVNNYKERWIELHGDDEDGEETGFHLVQNDGAYRRIFADNVINSIADGIYHLGFETNLKNRLRNEDGDANKRFEKVAWWLDSLLKDDMISGKLNNDLVKEVVGSTGTSFDKIIPVIYNDSGLLLHVSMSDIRDGANSANEMNKLLVEAIKETGVASDDNISPQDVRVINHYLVNNYAQRWAELHGDDEDDEETGYHKVQGDGARSRSYGKNIINRLGDSVYHLGFYTPYKYRLVNEDGNKNASFLTVSYWLNKSLQDDFAKGVFKK